jgi:hypothetical protein
MVVKRVGGLQGVGVVFSLIPNEGASLIAIRAALAALLRKKSSWGFV